MNIEIDYIQLKVPDNMDVEEVFTQAIMDCLTTGDDIRFVYNGIRFHLRVKSIIDSVIEKSRDAITVEKAPDGQ